MTQYLHNCSSAIRTRIRSRAVPWIYPLASLAGYRLNWADSWENFLGSDCRWTMQRGRCERRSYFLVAHPPLKRAIIL